MPTGYESTRLWVESLGRNQDPAEATQREALSAAYRSLRERATLLAQEIPQDMSEYTVHDITHLDALWEIASVICGPEVKLTPTEAFVLGGAMLVHDLGMSLAAWPGGITEVKADPQWSDIVAAAVRLLEGREPSADDLSSPRGDVLKRATETILRERHPARAAALPTVVWASPSGRETYHLIENADLRQRYGPLIGEIAASHGQSIDEVASRFGGDPIGAPADCPDEWTVDALKLACILRVADAAHLDERRAPGFLRALRHPNAYSDAHWAFQGLLQRPQRILDRLVFTSARAFRRDEAAAWWLCFETLQMVDGELSSVDSLLVDRNRTRFAARSVKGVSSPTRLAELLRTDDWEPVDAQIRVTNVSGLVRQLGGERLYGNRPHLALRELIQNARDASMALARSLDVAPTPVHVELVEEKNGEHWLSVTDHGIGMSRQLVTDVLLDFGRSYWGSDLMRQESVGLASSDFAAVGRFGIGFFSVFMLGDRVEVITRRFDEASADTRVLEFTEGATARPLLRRADAREVRHGGGTTVRVRLRTDPTREGGLLCGLEEPVSLAALCGYLAPALDVDVLVADRGAEPLRVVGGGDWTTLDPATFLRRLNPSRTSMFSHADEDIADVASRLRVIKVDGSPVARLGLAGSPPAVHDDHAWFDTHGYGTIGGLNSESRVGGFAGVAFARATTADRLRGELVISRESWVEWGTKQSELIAQRFNAEVMSGRYTEWGMALDLLHRLGVRPPALYLARDADRGYNRSELLDWMRGQDEVTLLDYAIDITTDEFGTDHFWLRETHQEVRLKTGVLISLSGSGRYGDWDLLPDPNPDKSLLPDDPDDDSEYARKLRWLYHYQQDSEGIILFLLAEAWGVSPKDLVASIELRRAGRQTVVGSFLNDGGEARGRFDWVARRPAD